jgi:drug/metabolite transporter (DMT)-like permease
MAIHFVTWLTSLRYISVARSTLLVSTSPLWASFVEFFAPNHKPGRQFWLGLALAAIGVLLFTQPWATSQKAAAIKDGPAWFGDAMALLGAIAIVPYLNLSQRVQAESGTLQAVTWIYVAGALCLWSVAIPMGQATVPTSAYVWFAFLGMAVFSQSIGHTALNWSMRHFTAGQVTAATLLEPVFAATFAWPLFGEAITTTQAVGGMIVLAGVAATLSPKPPPNLKA